jgi:hypothetical protein
MVIIRTLQDARPAQLLEFCYYCGEPFSTEPDFRRTRDHIPPRAVFHEDDRNWPLTVACHYRCNQERSLEDVKIAQLIQITRGQPVELSNIVLDVAPWPSANTEQPIGILTNLDLDAEIWRWVRGFHATLYRSYLPADRPHEIFTPIPKGEFTANGLQINDHPPMRNEMKQLLLLNLEAGRLDGIRSNNGKLLYSCAWVLPTFGGRWECCFGLKVYDWKTAGDPRFPRRDCFGRYTIDGKPSEVASISA